MRVFLSSFLSSLLFCLLFWASSALQAQNTGFRIEVKLANYNQDTLLLGYHLGDKQYVRDTAVKNAKGTYVFEADTLLPCGVYLVIMKPDNQYLQLMLSDTDQRVILESDAKDPYRDPKVKESADNKLFFDYMSYLATKRKVADPLSAQLDSTHTKAEQEAARLKLKEIDDDVKAYQRNLIEKNKQTMTAQIVAGSLDVVIPEFTGWKDSAELQMMRYNYYRDHYFDQVPLDNDCLLRTPLMQPKLMTYLEKVIPQHPDSIKLEVDKVLNKMGIGSDNFQYFVTSLLNFYSRPKYVGFDAVYCHMALTYYKDKTITPWVADTIRLKIVQNALAMEPTLVGKKAPNIEMTKQDGSKVKLHDVKADYTILLIWSPTCGHCKTSMPDFTAFYEQYKDKNVEIFAVCSVNKGEEPSCWEFIDKNGKMNWVNVLDPLNISRYRTLYDVKTTPRVFIMDKTMTIRSKQMESTQLVTVMEQMIQEDQRKLEKGK